MKIAPAVLQEYLATKHTTFQPRTKEMLQALLLQGQKQIEVARTYNVGKARINNLMGDFRKWNREKEMGCG